MNGSSQEDTQRTIEHVARESYGRLVAYLSVHTHDLASAEDALSNALVSALSHWPQDGVPQNPEAWLMTAARRSLIDVIRHQRVVSESEPTVTLLKENSTEAALSTEFPDERLKLLFVCAHPAIDPAMHTPLESVARAIFDGVEKGEEDIFPDPMSESMAESWRGGAAKALERQFAALVEAVPAN
jgi:predicted RNA polymerase sigma factor